MKRPPGNVHKARDAVDRGTAESGSTARDESTRDWAARESQRTLSSCASREYFIEDNTPPTYVFGGGGVCVCVCVVEGGALRYLEP